MNAKKNNGSHISSYFGSLDFFFQNWEKLPADLKTPEVEAAYALHKKAEALKAEIAKKAAIREESRKMEKNFDYGQEIHFIGKDGEEHFGKIRTKGATSCTVTVKEVIKNDKGEDVKINTVYSVKYRNIIVQDAAAVA